MTTSEAPRVFISYSHDDDAQSERVLSLATSLRRDGIDCRIDRWAVPPAQGWPAWMETEIRDADFVLLICTSAYAQRLRKEQERGGLGVSYEGHLITQLLYGSRVVTEKNLSR